MKNIIMLKMNNKTYDFLKWVTTIVLPAIATFYKVMAEIWGLPFAEQVPATIMGVVTLLGACLMYSSSKYKKEQEK